jgi:hypothetical protein
MYVLGMEFRVLKMVSMGTEAGIPMKLHQPMDSLHKHVRDKRAN